jgi:D-alanine-D-alanine ligase
MRIGFVYDIMENVFASHGTERIEELTTELFTASQANAIIAGLKELGHQVIVIDGAVDFLSRLGSFKGDVDLIFNEAKGLFGPDRKMAVPALCRIHNIPYLGSDAYTVTLARNKWHTLGVVAIGGTPIPKSRLFDAADPDEKPLWTKYPAIVKPLYESASIGITDKSVVYNVAELNTITNWVISTYQQPALVQEFVPGVEVQVSLIGNEQVETLAPVEVNIIDAERGVRQIITNDDWHRNNVTFSPCLIEVALATRINRLALRAFRDLGIRDYGRIDFRVTPDLKVYFIEAATHPHITPESSFAVAAGLSGHSFCSMLEALINTATERCRPQ